MTKVEMSEAIIVAKKESGLSWEEIATKVGLSSVFLTSACFGQNSLKAESAAKLCEVLSLEKEVADALMAFPYKSWDFSIPQDPLIYRLYEVVGVYGETMKAIIHEKFGDGIMSAIDRKSVV